MARKHGQARVASIVVTAGLLVVAAAGCRTRLDLIRANPTPEQQALGEREVDIGNRQTYVVDTNLRNFRTMLDRVLLLDRPAVMPLPSTR